MELKYKIELLLNRSKNDLLASEALFAISTKKDLKKTHELNEEITFYSNVINLAYYSIFYSAKAFLLSKNIQTSPPHEHNKVLERLKFLAESGVIDTELVTVFEKESIKASMLVSIFEEEKEKRGKFTYRKLPQSNKQPAEESLRNTMFFRKTIIKIIKHSFSFKK